MFLMYRVELKGGQGLSRQIGLGRFLMYRVELKGLTIRITVDIITRLVPNVPCGVESSTLMEKLKDRSLFLMYRVELKEQGQQGQR